MRKIMAYIIAMLSVILMGCGIVKDDPFVISNTENTGEALDNNSTEDLLDILLSDKWCESVNGDPELEFYKTGTGRYEGSMAQFTFVWSRIGGFDDCIRLEYEFMLSDGTMAKGTTDYELKNVDGIYQLNFFGEGELIYIRKSDFKK